MTWRERSLKHCDALAILAFGPNPWHGPWMNRQQILSRLGRRHDVVYSQGLVRPSWIVGRKRGERRWSVFGRMEPADNVWVDVPAAVFPEVDRLGALGRWLIRWGLWNLRRRAEKVWKSRARVVYAFAPRFADYIEHFRPAVTVYHAYDCFEKQAGWSEEAARRHRMLVQRADVVIASSEPIADWLRNTGAQDVHVVPNGVDFDSFCPPATFSEQDVPDDLKKIPRPRIGYFGNINRKVDLGLIDRLAGRRPGWRFVLVGGIRSLDEVTRGALERCRARKNVFFLGQKPHHEVPRYLWGMDVAIAAYRMDRELWTSSIYPLKLHEYLASGKPVVSSPIEAVCSFKEVVAIAATVEEWEAAIQKALSEGGEGTPARRMEVARANTWDARVDRIESIVVGALQ